MKLGETDKCIHVNKSIGHKHWPIIQLGPVALAHLTVVEMTFMKKGYMTRDKEI